ncbi:hypothetical protein E8E14_000476 [Neopestalotiopsis sp. 37M]|nr:hypothetical protein E8E14_000476 [Neopestalotiopsis sp. 37M]
MHELLAFSALYLGTTQTVETDGARYHQQAAELQASALALFSGTALKSHNENSLALFVFTSLIGMHILFDVMASHSNFTTFLNNVTRYSRLHRGVSAITNQSWYVLRDSEIRYIIDFVAAGDKLYRQELGETEN